MYSTESFDETLQPVDDLLKYLDGPVDSSSIMHPNRPSAAKYSFDDANKPLQSQTRHKSCTSSALKSSTCLSFSGLNCPLAENAPPRQSWSRINAHLQQHGLAPFKLSARGTPDSRSLQRSMQLLLDELTDKTDLIAKLSEDNMRLATELGQPRWAHAPSLFRTFLHREPRAGSTTDAQVLSLITALTSHSSELAPQLYTKLEVQSPNEVLLLVDKMQEVVEALPKVQSFLNEVVREVLGKSHEYQGGQFNDRVLRTLRRNKEYTEQLRRFKIKVCETLGVAEEHVLNTCKAMSQFQKLFQARDDAAVAVEELYWFVHEVKTFLKRARRRLGLRDSEPVSEVLACALEQLQSS